MKGERPASGCGHPNPFCREPLEAGVGAKGVEDRVCQRLSWNRTARSIGSLKALDRAISFTESDIHERSVVALGSMCVSLTKSIQRSQGCLRLSCSCQHVP